MGDGDVDSGFDPGPSPPDAVVAPVAERVNWLQEPTRDWLSWFRTSNDELLQRYEALRRAAARDARRIDQLEKDNETHRATIEKYERAVLLLKEDRQSLGNDVETLRARLDRLIAKLDASRFRAALVEKGSGLSSVKAGDGASREAVRSEYSSLVDKLNRLLVKRDRHWRERTDASVVAAHLIQLLVDALDRGQANSAALRDFRREAGGGPDVSETTPAIDLPPHLSTMLATTLKLMNSLDYWLVPSGAGPFPGIAALVAEEVEMVHDGKIETAMAIVGGAP